VRAARQNKNVVASFSWVRELLELIVQGRARDAVADTSTQRRATPLFVIAGACPNSLCGMQAVLYSAYADLSVDFWWVKPRKDDPNRPEKETWNLHRTGRFRNSAGVMAKSMYQPFADRFAGCSDAGLAYGVDDAGRAYIDEGDGCTRMFVYLVWQESWSKSMARSKKFLQGKLCYQRRSAPGSSPDLEQGIALYARQYRVQDSNLFIASREDEEAIPALLPTNPSFQELYDVP
jgi:hypothetical protein